jgi:hypothetical protein
VKSESVKYKPKQEIMQPESGLQNTTPPGESKLPTLQELFDENIKSIGKYEGLNKILSTPPPTKWVKEHPYISNYKYLPIDKVEYLLRKIFKRYRIKITGQGTAFNGVWVTVRVYYLDPVSNEMDWQDGIGAIQLQTKSGTSPADLININNGAVSMAFPIAKTMAIKDACDLIGDIFGANLNRRDVQAFEVDPKIAEKYANVMN